MIQQTSTTRAPSKKREQAERAFAQLVAAALREGYYGTATLTLNVQDGRIQHVKIGTERTIK